MTTADDRATRSAADRHAAGEERFRLRDGETLAAGLKWVLADELREAIAVLADAAISRSEAIHLVRRRLKRVRSLFAVIDEVPGANRRDRIRQVRDTGRLLAEGRDADVVAFSAGRLAAEGDGEVVAAAGRLAARLAEEARAAHAATVPIETVVGRLRASEADVRSLPEAFPAGRLLAAALAASYRGGRRDWRDCADGGSQETLHDWRKQVKDRRHLSTMVPFETLVTSRPVRHDLERLAEFLGDERDFALLAARIAATPEIAGRRSEREMVEAAIARRRRRLIRAALALGEELYGERTRNFAAEIAALDAL